MKKTAIYILILLSFTALLIYPQTASDAVNFTVKNTVTKVIPSIFPFMVLSDFIILYLPSKTYNKKGNAPLLIAITVIGNLSGFPVGAKSSALLCKEGRITKTNALKLAVVSGNAGISFVLSYVGAGLFSNRKIGMLLYFSQISAAFLSCLIYAALLKNKPTYNESKLHYSSKTKIIMNFEDAFTASVASSALAVLNVAAFITVFGVIIEYVNMFLSLLTDNAIIKSVIAAFLEISNGCAYSLMLKPPVSIAVCSFALGFSGLSVICQSINFLKKAEINTTLFIILKAIQGVISALITSVLISFINVTEDVSAFSPSETYMPKKLSYLVLAIILLYAVVNLKKLALKLRKA